MNDDYDSISKSTRTRTRNGAEKGFEKYIGRQSKFVMCSVYSKVVHMFRKGHPRASSSCGSTSRLRPNGITTIGINTFPSQ